MDKQKTNNFITAEELKRMREVDIRTVDKNDLVDIETVEIRTDLPKEERIMDYIRQIKNPYCYLYKGMVIKVSFAGKRKLEDCLKDCLFTP
jgi:hypothetical protein